MTEGRARVVELLNRMGADSQEVERLPRAAGCEGRRVDYQADLTRYVVQQRPPVSQDWGPGWARRRYVPKTGRRYATKADTAEGQGRRDGEG